ncbi:glycosyltransferase family 2 protein [Flavobacterium quisquiliarum]|uniref:Glycosyltransferase family 2 protein n=1 Tax=Flavobacterium quisquiliarum TaxID=1834436 RepID=A0ABV8W0V5_9FLAO|nr:glycosyltransferase family 2 protein [Flavobacterium quisquiliarum]MBW1655017.1 glycosyltransferase [Flavobacterium quisquiliarum]NWL02608.1 family 2 glycosyl transferase [Flavobacterium collinsii]
MKYSIGIPAFKGRYLNDCIDSILSQTFKDFELIVVNDCSPDGIHEIVKGFKDPRINYYENEVNIGAENVIDNWNKCLSFAQGDFFVLMGDDDKLAPDYLREFDKLIDKYPDLDVFHCRIRIINENSEEIELSTICPEYEDTDNYILNCLEGRSEQFISDFVYRKSTLVSNGGFYKLPLAWSSDYISAFIASGNKGIAYTSSPVFFYRKHQSNITSTSSLELKRIAIIGMENWLEKYLNSSKKTFQPLTVAFKKFEKENKEAFIRQMIGRSRLNGLYLCIVKRKLFKIYVVNFISLLYNMWLKN